MLYKTPLQKYATGFLCGSSKGEGAHKKSSVIRSSFYDDWYISTRSCSSGNLLQYKTNDKLCKRNDNQTDNSIEDGVLS